MSVQCPIISGRRRTPNSVAHCGALVAVGMLSAIAAAQVVDGGLSRLKLRCAAVVSEGALRLADVLSFDEADPALLAAVGSQPVVTPPRRVGAKPNTTPVEPAPSPTVVTHDQIVGRLTELGVNMARVLVCGAAECQISTVAPSSAAAEGRNMPGAVAPTHSAATMERETTDVAEAPLMRMAAPDQNAAQTLADALRRHVQRELRERGGAEVEFERAGGEILALTSPPWEFNIRGSDTGKLGLREFSVALKRDGRTQRTVKIGANVKLMRRVLVATRPLSVGTTIRDDDLAAEERLFESVGEVGHADPLELLGQQVQRFVPAGEMLRRGDVKSVDLVQRSRPVTVMGAGGAVSLQMTGVALDAGGYGETVRVRLGDTRKEQREVRGVVTGIATVRIGAEGV